MEILDLLILIYNANIYIICIKIKCAADQPGKPRCSLSLRNMMSDMLGMASAFSFDSSSALDGVVDDEGSDNDNKPFFILINTHLCYNWKCSSTCVHNDMQCHLLVWA